MTKQLRQQCEALSLELFGNKNSYRKIQSKGLTFSTDSGLIKIQFTDNEVLAFLENIKNQKAKAKENELSKEKPNEGI